MSKENDLTVGKAESTAWNKLLNIEGFNMPLINSQGNLGRRMEISKHHVFTIKDELGERNLDLSMEQWAKLIEDTQTVEELKIEQPKQPKHYLGDIRWVLYQYICDMNGKDYAFRCGRYALDKIMNMTGFSENGVSGSKNDTETYCGTLNLNGEKITIISNDYIIKKELIILKDYEFKPYGLVDLELKPNDIVLYFS